MMYPEMVKTNHRHRGPMESRKQTNSMKDIRRSIEIVREELLKRRESSRALMGDLLVEYNHNVRTNRSQVVNGVNAVRGGEL